MTEGNQKKWHFDRNISVTHVFSLLTAIFAFALWAITAQHEIGATQDDVVVINENLRELTVLVRQNAVHPVGRQEIDEMIRRLTRIENRLMHMDANGK